MKDKWEECSSCHGAKVLTYSNTGITNTCYWCGGAGKTRVYQRPDPQKDSLEELGKKMSMRNYDPESYSAGYNKGYQAGRKKSEQERLGS